MAMFRIGVGYDSHRFVQGRKLMLCGIHVPHSMGLSGHSDADAALHAVVDAILGAAGIGDIGELFPDSDPKFKDAPSCDFVAEALKRAAGRGYQVNNCDLTIITQSPRLMEHKQAMRDKLAQLLGLDAAAVAVKAKTNEHMGFVGRGEGLAAIAAVSLVACESAGAAS